MIFFLISRMITTKNRGMSSSDIHASMFSGSHAPRKENYMGVIIRAV